MKINLTGLLPEEIASTFPDLKRFRSIQLFQWLHKSVFDFNAMTNLPQELRIMLAQRSLAVSSLIIQSQKASDASAKFKVRLSDGRCIESVLLTDKAGRNTICVSTQVGCAMGCAFCGTAGMGLVRNLAAHEIVEQYLLLKQLAVTISHVVFMGMGEPLANLSEVSKAIALLHHPEGSGIGLRRMTISTCGYLPGLRELIKTGPYVRLALSLISADPETRNMLVPQAKANPLPELKQALQAYQQVTGKRITLEIVLLPGVNDRQHDIVTLQRFTESLKTVINIIPWNKISGLAFREPSKSELADFITRLTKSGFNVTQRYSKGRSINAACGQLCTPQK
ncbi:MAG: 23S rRNA (adenine(2503)-C(2))-methyltransferase RlmN [Spirochaetales bacterium]|nr:23S rRNA (adenine(2503)-C(2))-methyltransferase RlmN [Spirochaetales bacterium]